MEVYQNPFGVLKGGFLTSKEDQSVHNHRVMDAHTTLLCCGIARVQMWHDCKGSLESKTDLITMTDRSPQGNIYVPLEISICISQCHCFSLALTPASAFRVLLQRFNFHHKRWSFFKKIQTGLFGQFKPLLERLLKIGARIHTHLGRNREVMTGRTST